MTRTDKLLTIMAGVMGCLVILSALACGGGAEEPPAPNSSFDSCGGIQGLICQNQDEVCIMEQSQNCGRFDQMGTCQLPPQACTEQYEPVCGCDGKTYSNECKAHAAGVSVESQGECPSTTKACGARLGDTCASDQVCVYSEQANCGRADATGTCQMRPTICTHQYAPVCGCNGQTYSNECQALAAGVSVDHQGSCQTSPGCSSNADCAVDEYCGFDTGDQCGAGGQGVCNQRAQACPQHYDPVCGCDGRTYSNACMASSSGVSVAHDGACAGAN